MAEKTVNYYSIPSAEAMKKLGTSADGLDDGEIEKRSREFGPNVLKERKKKTVFQMFVDEFKDFVILLLIAAAVIAAITEVVLPDPENTAPPFIDSIAIIAIVVINAIIGVYQEYNAGKAIEALRKLIAPKAAVLRNGRQVEIHTANLVPGDIIVLHEGDKVPADGRLIKAHNLEILEASLTGESVPVIKKADSILKDGTEVADLENMAFMGTLVTKGEAQAVVCFTGNSTQIGKIADLVQTIEDEETPLQKKLEQLGKRLGKLAIAATVLVFVVGVSRAYLSHGVQLKELMDLFLIAVSLAVAAIPEGLPAVVTIALAIGVQRMAKRNSIIRSLPAAEGLGSSTVICSDKTGTLTKNEMTVRKIFTNSKVYNVTGEGYSPSGEIRNEKGDAVDAEREPNFSQLIETAILCNNAALTETGVIGDPTEACLLVAGRKAGFDYEKEKRDRKLLEELTFDSERKMMTVIYGEHEAGTIAYVKGAPENLLDACSSHLKNGRMEKLDAAGKDAILKKNSEFASSGLRVLGFAYRPLKTRKTENFNIPDVETELVFLGLMAMMDPPRPEVKKAIGICKGAGIRAVMITGDNELTARAIAKELAMFDEKHDRVITGRQLEAMSDLEFEKIAASVAVYARVSPEHKMRIVAALQKQGDVVAMTGDGVNDAPAIKKADIGVAMGITGTDVAKESADMVITDDNFASIVAAVEEGRIIFDNIMKAVKYLISCNIGEVFVIFFAIMIGWASPLLAIQILWMNLATDALPALALASDAKARDIMQRKPRDAKQPLISDADLKRLAFIGVLISIGTLGLFWFFNETQGVEKARTVAFSTIIFFQLFIAISWHTGRDMFVKVGILNNKFLIAAVLGGLAAQVAIVQTGVLEVVFKTVPLTPMEWLSILLVSASILVMEEVIKHLMHFRKTGSLL